MRLTHRFLQPFYPLDRRKRIDPEPRPIFDPCAINLKEPKTVKHMVRIGLFQSVLGHSEKMCKTLYNFYIP